MSENNNICKLNFTCKIKSDFYERLKFICSESGNKFVYSFQDGILVDDLNYLLKSSKYMTEAFPKFIQDSIKDNIPRPKNTENGQVDVENVTPCPDYSNIKIIINREYVIGDDIYSENLMKSFMESIEPYFEAFEN